MLNKKDAESAKEILIAAGWRDIAVYCIGEYPGRIDQKPFPVYVVQAMPPHLSMAEKYSFNSLRDVISYARDTPIKHYRGNLEATILKETNRDVYDEVSNLVSDGERLVSNAISQNNEFARILQKYADNPKVIRLIAESLKGQQ